MVDEKKILFVLGTVRSGTTLLNLFLGNKSKNALILGEVANLFNPKQKNHFDEIKRIKNEDERWARILADSPKNLYKNLTIFFPEVSLFIDSSKDAFWVNTQIKQNCSEFDIKSILIYKPYILFRDSLIKRGQDNNVNTVYVNHHKRYFSLLEQFYVVSYLDFVNFSDKREGVCNYAGIEYFPEKDEIDLKKIVYNFFGSPSFVDDSKLVRIEPLIKKRQEPLLKDFIEEEVRIIEESLEKMNEDGLTTPPVSKGLIFSKFQLELFRLIDIQRLILAKIRNCI